MWGGEWGGGGGVIGFQGLGVWDGLGSQGLGFPGCLSPLTLGWRTIGCCIWIYHGLRKASYKDSPILR